MKREFIAKIDELFVEWNNIDSPGFSLLIIKDSKILHKHSYGMASLEHSIPISTTSVFDIGSTSKQFVAFCIMILVKKGRISLGDEVQKYIPEMTKYKYPIAIHHLIHHTSGIRDYLTLMDLAGMRFENEYPDEEIIELITRQKELNFKPGEEFLYSNSGYLLLGEIIKRVSGQSLRCFAEENIFSPLGMKNTHFHDDFTMIVKNKATGYSSEKEGFKVDMSIFDVVGDGGVNTTVEDLFLWDQNFYHNRLGGCGQNLIKKVTTTGKLNNGKNIGYACGLFVGKYKGMKMISHGGAWMGYRAEILRFPKQKFSVVCLSNLSSANPTMIAKQIVDSYFPSLEKKESIDSKFNFNISPSKILKKCGFYFNSKTGNIIELMVKNGEILLDKYGKIYPLEGVCLNYFTSTDKQVGVEFKENDPKKIFLMLGEKCDVKSEVYNYMDSVSLKVKELKAFEGRYWCEEINVNYAIKVEKGKLQLMRKGNKKEPLTVISENLLKGMFVTLQFKQKDSAEHRGFYLAAGRVKNIFFVKKNKITQ
jgi:CubicO group peptidase (beta-lactamase class C family)